MTSYGERSSSPEWDQCFDYYEEEVLTESAAEHVSAVIPEPVGDSTSQISQQRSETGHPFDERTVSFGSFPEEYKTEMVFFPRQSGPQKSSLHDILDPSGRLRLEASGAPVVAQRPLLLPQGPQGETSLSLTRMPQEQSSSDSTRSTRQKQSMSLTTVRTPRNLPVDYPSSFAGKHTVDVAPAPASSVFDIEDDHLLSTNQMVCYRGNECAPYEPPKYLHDTDQKGSVILKALALLLLFMVLVLAVVAAVLYFVVFKDDSNRAPTMTPTAESSVGTQPTPGPFTFTVSCSGRITTMTEESIGKYETLTTELMVPNVYPSWNHSLDSCDPANQAMVWLSTESTEGEIDRLQRYIMALTYFSTAGTGWESSDNWMTDRSVCDWEGVGCDSQGDILKMDLAKNRLTGPMISELGFLPKLQVITLQDNSLSGSLPTEVISLPDLNIVNLSENRLIGQVHNILFGQNLEFLSLHGNRLTGALPQLGQATLLKTLDLGQNNFRGTLPTEFNQLTMLSYLNMEDNALITGRLPTEFGLYTNLYFLSISNTSIRARIPTQYSTLSNLLELRMAGTLVGGDIPEGVANLTSLRHLDLSSSRFRKSLPTFLGDLTKLTHLSLHNNSLTSFVPSELGTLSSITMLSLDGNAFSGTLPSELGDLSKLEALTVHDNALITGLVPDELCSLREKELMIFTTSCPSRNAAGDQLGVSSFSKRNHREPPPK